MPEVKVPLKTQTNYLKYLKEFIPEIEENSLNHLIY